MKYVMIVIGLMFLYGCNSGSDSSDNYVSPAAPAPAPNPAPANYVAPSYQCSSATTVDNWGATNSASLRKIYNLSGVLYAFYNTTTSTTVRRSTDGSNWTTVDSFTDGESYGWYQDGTNLYYLAQKSLGGGSYLLTVRKSTNGTVWSSVGSFTGSYSLNSQDGVFTVYNNAFYMSAIIDGNATYILKSTDNGASWSIIFTNNFDMSVIGSLRTVGSYMYFTNKPDASTYNFMRYDGTNFTTLITGNAYYNAVDYLDGKFYAARHVHLSATGSLSRDDGAGIWTILDLRKKYIHGMTKFNELMITAGNYDANTSLLRISSDSGSTWTTLEIIPSINSGYTSRSIVNQPISSTSTKVYYALNSNSGATIRSMTCWK